VSSNFRDVGSSDQAKLRRTGADRVDDIGRRQMFIVFFNHSGSVAQVIGTMSKGAAAMIDSEA
jgi:hypothetical protein